VTKDELLAEQFSHGATDERIVSPLRPWTPAEQAHHRAELLAAMRKHKADAR
jgi:hypothetical protein